MKFFTVLVIMFFSTPLCAQEKPIELAAHSLYDTVYINDIFFLQDAQTGWAVGDHAAIIKTTDGGGELAGGKQPWA